MRQGLVSLPLEIQDVIPLAQAAGMFPNVCTIQKISGALDSLGAEVMTFSDVSGLVGIPCHSAPTSTENINGSDELRMQDRVDERQERHVLLAGYFPQIEMNMRAVVDGEAWNIVGVEHDSFHSQTRLQVQEYAV